MADQSPNATEDEVAALLDAVIAGERRAIARAMTALETGSAFGRRLLHGLDRYARGCIVIGVTGPPGAGKSSLVNALMQHWRQFGHTVAVIAVDPSSPLSGGALLGDRIRMTAALDDDGVFVRSLASRGHLGGLSPAAAQLIDVLDVAGFDRIVLETVGTGQSETDVAQIADIPVVVAAPGLGDDIQAMKSGLLEVAALLVVNKADLAGAAQTFQQLKGAVSMRPQERSEIPALAVSAARGDGIADLAETLDTLQSAIANGDGAARRLRRTRYVIAQAATALVRQAVSDRAPSDCLDDIARAALSGDIDVDDAARQLLRTLADAEATKA